MKILVGYATYSGGTQKAAEFITQELSKIHTVTIRNIENINPSDFQDFELVILGSCTWERTSDKKDGQLHVSFDQFIEKARDAQFPDKKFAIFGLGDSEYIHFCRAAEYLSAFVKELKGIEIIEPLKLNSFFFNEKESMEKIKTWTAKLETTIGSG